MPEGCGGVPFMSCTASASLALILSPRPETWKPPPVGESFSIWLKIYPTEIKQPQCIRLKHLSTITSMNWTKADILTNELVQKPLRTEQEAVVSPGDRMRRMRRRKRNDADFTEKARQECAGGEHTGTGRGCRGRPQCGTVHEKTERRNKNRQHANSQQRDDRVKEYAAWHHGSILWVKCVVERLELGDGRQTGDRPCFKS